MLFDGWRLALGTLTAWPVRPPGSVDRQRAGIAMLLGPVAAVPLGAAAGAVALLGNRLDLPPLVVAFVALGAVVLGDRALHLDGLADTADGLAASYDRERSLAVMKSGTSGPAGVVALVLVLGVQAAGMAGVLGLPDELAAAVLIGLAVCGSRAALVVCCAHGVRPARTDGLGVTYTETVPRSLALVVWLIVAVLLAAAGDWAGLAWWRGALAGGVALLVVMAVVARAVRRFGGVTGDVFGASIELALAAMLVTLA
jgi:adenosylcobinamide-GDP ribazoletransferase